MPSATLEQAYERFSQLYSNSRPIRDLDAFAAAVKADGIEYERVDLDWLESLNHDWIYLDVDEPFKDERANREYRRLLSV